MTTATEAYGRDTTTDELLEGVDLTGITAVVTGASGGIGLETARALAAHGATVVAAARDVAKAERALADAGVWAGSSSVVELDLSSLASVRAAADRVLADHDRLGLVIANAGVMSTPEGRTVDGFETQLGTNHLGHFVFVNRLVPALVAGAPSRVVCLSSAAHLMGDVDLDDLGFDRRDYVPNAAYGASKTANALFAVELDRRLRDRGVRAVAVHPGTIFTDLGRHLSAESLAVMKARPGKTIAQGAATTVWAAVVADADEVGGRYAEDCHVAEVEDGPVDWTKPMSGVRSYALDPDRAARLWSLSEDLVGERFEL
jgi:NAD(P)-dependent dehydrogenase (short-subunit alcohol dehydrogenase family)